jgi:hypothetical protein
MINPAVTEIVTLAANVALALSLVVAVIFGIAQVRAAARDRRDRLTLDMLRQFQTREFAELIHRTLLAEAPRNYDEFRALPTDDYVEIVQLGQQMESIGILVAEEFIDIGLVDKTLGSFVTSAWEKFQPLYLDMRVKMDDPFLAEYFQWLAELIAQRMRDNPRQPFYKTGA